MNAGFYSPLPPARSGVADYSAALLVGLRSRQAEVADRAARHYFRQRELPPQTDAALLAELRRSGQAEVADRVARPDFRLRALAVTRGRKRREP